MPNHHLAAWAESVDQTIANITPLGTDEGETFLRTNGDNLTVHQALPGVAAAWVGSASIERARLVSPSLRPQLHDLSALDGAEPGTPPALNAYWRTPLPLDAGEQMQVQVENDDAGAAEDVTALIWWCQGPIQQQPVPHFTVRATTAAAALTAEEWTARTLTLDNDLRSGRYAVVGANAVGATLRAMRFVDRETALRPGVLCRDAVGDVQSSVFRGGRLGEFTQFDHDQPPDVEFLADEADNEVQEVYLDLVRVS